MASRSGITTSISKSILEGHHYSLSSMQAGAAEKGVPLWKHIADLAGNKKVVLPVPSLNIINGESPAGLVSR
jgi:enolase